MLQAIRMCIQSDMDNGNNTPRSLVSLGCTLALTLCWLLFPYYPLIGQFWVLYLGLRPHFCPSECASSLKWILIIIPLVCLYPSTVHRGSGTDLWEHSNIISLYFGPSWTSPIWNYPYFGVNSSFSCMRFSLHTILRSLEPFDSSMSVT